MCRGEDDLPPQRQGLWGALDLAGLGLTLQVSSSSEAEDRTLEQGEWPSDCCSQKLAWRALGVHLGWCSCRGTLGGIT